MSHNGGSWAGSNDAVVRTGISRSAPPRGSGILLEYALPINLTTLELRMAGNNLSTLGPLMEALRRVRESMHTLIIDLGHVRRGPRIAIRGANNPAVNVADLLELRDTVWINRLRTFHLEHGAARRVASMRRCRDGNVSCHGDDGHGPDEAAPRRGSSPAAVDMRSERIVRGRFLGPIGNTGPPSTPFCSPCRPFAR